jgi:hypothetical protein
MQEFMLLIRNHGDGKKGMSETEHLAFVKKCEVYIDKLKKEKRLLAAQPLIREGIILSGYPGEWSENPVNVNNEIQVGYYHILANDLADAINVAKQNPEFEYVPNASIEVRPIKMKENATDFVYPTK